MQVYSRPYKVLSKIQTNTEKINQIHFIRQIDNALLINQEDNDTIKRIALLIGNSKYKIYPLKYSANDILLLSKTLQVFNFEVTELLDGNKERMEEALQKFFERISKTKGVGLLYYSGHSVVFNDINYLLPVDYKITKEINFESECIDLNSILEKMKISGAFLKIVILVKCHQFPSDLRNFSVSPYFNIHDLNIDNLLIAINHSTGICDCEKPCNYSLYNQELIKAIKTKGYNINEVFKLVRKNVTQFTKQQQVPWEYSSFEGEFYFNQ